MSVIRPLTESTSVSSDWAEKGLVAPAPASYDQPAQEVLAPDGRRFKDWPTLVALGAAGVLTLGWTSVLAWALWRLIKLAVL